MSNREFPESWAQISFGEIFRAQKGKKPKKLHLEKVASTIPYVDIKAFSDGKGIQFADPEDSKIVEKDDVVIVWDGSRSGLVGKAIYGALGSTLGRFPKCQLIDNDFLLYFLRSNYKILNENKKGAGIPHLNPDVLYKLIFPIPALAEQGRIVARIESTQEKVKTIETGVSKVQELIEKYHESLLQKAFRGELASEDPNDEPASKLIERIYHERAKQSDGKKKRDELPPVTPEEIPFAIPKSWEWVRLGAICKFEQGLQVDTSEQKTERGRSQVPFWRIINFTQNDPDIRYIDDPGADYHISENDIVMVRYGATAGFSAAGRAGVLANNLFTIRSEIVEANYLLQFFRSKFYQNELARFVRGGAMPAINFEFMKNLFIPLPPKNVQIAIAKYISSALDKCDQHKAHLNNTLVKLNCLRESILINAFSGRLVPQILSEGTGHDLLEKICRLNPVQNEKSHNKASLPKVKPSKSSKKKAMK